ncbi:lipoprotein NlpD [Oryzomicrobium terrae]|uniref:Lipoprotein NlpD n=1 Tax=Oryzomicrobium terrae TaxID=1735038 RepID=A0A5C1E9S1_9RHOO|nr:peptidoglycan DD-metalloendopeptidase family protein [Oryzomicrobium terrae]QEL65640.1 lipoprotein NlpD [Oryzomicrobium terrae]
MISRRSLFSLASLALAAAGCATQQPAPVVDRGQVAPRGASAAAVPGCPETYTVKKGDTLYSIALDHGADYRDVIIWNRIENPNRILVGQVLCVKAPAEAVGSSVAVAKPIGPGAAIEKRSLDGAGVTTVPLAPATSDGLKREPRAGKEPYTDQALAAAQAGNTVPAAKAEQKIEPKTETKQEPRDSKEGDEPAWSWPASGKTLSTFSDTTKGIDIAGKQGDPVLAAAEGKVVYAGVGLRGYGKLVIIKHNAAYLTAYAHNSNVLVKEGQSVVKGQKIAEIGNTDTDTTKLHFEVRRQGKPVDPLKYLPPR